MTDRFETWWPTNPARLLLSAEAKEVARSVWNAARADMVAEMQEAVAQAPNPTFKEMNDALWVSQLGVIELERGAPWVSRLGVLNVESPPPPPVCTNSDTWNCKYCRKTDTCEALKAVKAHGLPVVKGAAC